MKNLLLGVAAPCLVCLVLSSTNSTAQENQLPAISTERPTVGNSPDLIPGGSIQFENGTNASVRGSQVTLDLPETLFRVGITDRVEVRYAFSDEVYQHSYASSVPSLQTMDPSLSAKFATGKANGITPRSAIVGMSVPIGGQSWTSGSYDPSLTMIWTQSFRKSYFLNEVAGATLTTLNSARRTEWAPSIAGGRAITERLGTFAEFAPTVLTNGSMEYVLDGGFALVPHRLTQFDLRTGYLKDQVGYHTLISLGYSLRVDHFMRIPERLLAH